MSAAELDAAELLRQRNAFRDQRNAVFATNEELLLRVERTDLARLQIENENHRLIRRIAELEAQVRALAVDAMGALPMPTGGGAPVHELTAYEQLFLTFALELAADQIALRPEEFDAADDEALASLRRLTGEQEPTPEELPARDEYRFCGATLERSEYPYTCNRRVAHQGPCSGELDEEAPRG